MSNGIGRIWAVNAEGGDEGRPNSVGPVYIENIDKLGSQLPEPEAGDAGKVLGVLNSNGDIGWVPDQEGMAQVQADWDQTDSSQVSYIANKPSNLVQDADYVHTDNNFTDADKSKLGNIESGAQVNVKPNWDATAGSAAEILNKPTIPTVDQNYNASSTNAQSGTAVASAVSNAVSGINQVPASTSTDSGKVLKVNAQGVAVWGTDEGTTYTAGNGLSLNGTEFSVDTSVVATQNDLSDYQPVISDLETIRSGASAGATAVQPGSLATVATTGSYDDLLDKPTIPPGVTVDQVYDAASTNAQSGTAVAGAISNVRQVPSASSGDNGKVLGVTDSAGTLGWVSQTPGTTVDQTYNASSTNAQSGTAVAGAISTKQDTISDLETIRSGAAAGATAVQPGDLPATKPLVAGSNVTITENANNVTISATDTDTTYSAGTGLSLSGTTFNIDKPVPTTQSSDNGKVLGVTDSSGTLGWVSQTPGVTVDQSYNASSTNAQSGTAVAQAVANAGLYEATYDVSTYAEVKAAFDLHKIVYCKVGSRQAFLAYTNTTSSSTSNRIFEFQYYRSNSTEGAGDSVFVYRLAYDNTWTTTERAAYVNADWNSNSGASQVLNKPTIPSVDQNYNAASTNAQSGVAVAQAIAGISMDEVPDVGSSDDGKVLTASYSGGQGAYSWQTAQGGASYTAGDGIDITNDEISAKLGDGLEIGTSLSPVTATAHAIGCTNQEAGGVSVMQQLDASLVAAIETTGLTYTVQNLTDNGNVSRAWSYWGANSLKLYPAICAIASSNLGPFTDPGMRLVLSTTGMDIASAAGTISAGTQFAYNLDDVNTSLSTITWETISAHPENYSLSVVWQGSWSVVSLSALGSYTANALYDSGTLSYQSAVLGAIAVSNPVPAYNTSTDNGKVLSVGSNGLEWDTPQGGSTYTAGTGISIISDTISVTTDDTISSVYPLFADSVSSLTNDGSESIAYFDSNNAGSPLGPVLNSVPHGTLRIVCSAGRFFRGSLSSTADIKAYVVVSSDTYFNDFAVYPEEIPATYDQEENGWYVDAVDVTVPTVVSTSNGWISRGSPNYGSMRYIGIGFGTSPSDVTTGTIGYGNIAVEPTITFWYPNVTAPQVLSVGIRIQQVNALPATPDANTLYLIPEA